MATATSTNQIRPTSIFGSSAGQWLLPCALAGFVLARCVMLSSKRLLWADEFFTWYPASASFGSMLSSTVDTINAAPPVYGILSWLWAHAFGCSPLSLRLLSALAMGAAILSMFHVLRHVYGVLVATLAVAVALTFCDPALTFWTAQARFHTLVIAEVALAILLYQRLMAWQGRASFRLLAANSGIHACLVMTHYFGPLYSGAILVAVLLTGAVNRFNPWRAAASIVLGWAVFLPWIPVFLRHQEMGKPSFWIPVPDAAALRVYYGHYLTGDFWLLSKGLLLSLAAGFSLVLGPGGRLPEWFARLFSIRRREWPLLLLIPGIGSIPLIAYFLSTRPGGTSIFIDRYLLSGALGWAIVCAHLIHRAFTAGLLSRHRRLSQALGHVQTAGVAAALCWGGWVLLRQGFKAIPETLGAEITVESHTHGKIVVEHIHEFLTRNFYAPQPQRYVFVVDYEVGLKEGGGGPGNHVIMAALKRNFPDRFTGVISNDEFLPGAPSFWLKRGGTPWWSMRIEHNPLFSTEGRDGILTYVERIPPPQSTERENEAGP